MANNRGRQQCIKEKSDLKTFFCFGKKEKVFRSDLKESREGFFLQRGVVSHQGHQSTVLFTPCFLLTFIYPLTARVVGAPQYCLFTLCFLLHLHLSLNCQGRCSITFTVLFCSHCASFFTCTYPLTARVVGAPQYCFVHIVLLSSPSPIP